ncbi:MAG: hypothetical protein V5786_03635 [Psychromonas sp.]
MTVEQFNPLNQGNKTTTLETPKKVLAEQSVNAVNPASVGSRIGFISLGCPSTSNPILSAA